MAFCSKCGAELETDAKACPSCGATVGETSEKKENGSDFGARAEEAFNKFNDTKDDTSAFDPADIESNKVMGILSYLSWLVLIPLIAAPKSRRTFSDSGDWNCFQYHPVSFRAGVPAFLDSRNRECGKRQSEGASGHWKNQIDQMR